MVKSIRAPLITNGAIHTVFYELQPLALRKDSPIVDCLRISVHVLYPQRKAVGICVV